MKTLNITFTDAEFKRLLKAKRKYSLKSTNWHYFIIVKCCEGITKWS